MYKIPPPLYIWRG